MAISAELLEILICPACRAKVELKSDLSGLRCVSCHRLYPIRDDIPVMLIDEAIIDEERLPFTCRSAAWPRDPAARTCPDTAASTGQQPDRCQRKPLSCNTCSP